MVVLPAWSRLVFCVVAGGACVGCVAPRRPIVAAQSSEAAILAWAFAPETMRIHPLTQLEVAPDSEAAIACHLELRDRWGDTVKAVGALQVQLYRPLPGTDASDGVQELVWDVDLADLSRNAAWFDPVTRTYRVRLTGLPAWVEAMAAAADAGEASADRELRLRAVLRTVDPDGRERVLRDDMVLRR